jgi:hypothetical protein
MSLEHSQAVSTEEQIENLRRNLKFYNGLQMKLMRMKYGSDAEIQAHYEEWEYMYSPEFEQAFKAVMKEMLLDDPTFLDHFSEVEEITLEKIQNMINVIHSLEEKLIAHSDDAISSEAITWHKEFGIDLMKIIHAHPDILNRYEESQDKAPEHEEAILREIEDLLYYIEK